MTVKYDLLLDPVSGDMPLYPVLSNGIEKIAQSAMIAVRLHRREVLLDQTKGLPYFEWGQMKPFRINEVSDYVRNVIESLDGVKRISQWSSQFDKATRRALITGTVVVEDGSEFSVSVLPSGTERGNSNPLSYFTIVGIPKIYTKGIR